MQSSGWQSTLCGTWCLIWWFACWEKSMVIHDTECPYWDQVSLNNTNPNPAIFQNSSWTKQMNLKVSVALACLAGKYEFNFCFLASTEVLFQACEIRLSLLVAQCILSVLIMACSPFNKIWSSRQNGMSRRHNPPSWTPSSSLSRRHNPPPLGLLQAV